MKIEIGSPYIYARPIEAINSKPAWAIVNKRAETEIACVSYYQTWKRYVMVTDGSPTVFDEGCLGCIIGFIKTRPVSQQQSPGGDR